MKQQTVFTGEDQTEENNLSKKLPDEKMKKIIEAAYTEGLNDGKTQQKEPNTSLKESGREEGIKEHAKEQAKTQEKIKRLSERQEVALLEIKTLFPFDLFPDTLHIDTTKVTVITKEFFGTEQVHVLSFKDILDITLERSLFLGNVNITYLPKSESMGMIEPKVCKIQLLRYKEAKKARDILKGMLLARREGVDVTQIAPSDLQNMINKYQENISTDHG